MIHRDAYGVAHAFGETDAAALFGFAYARAEDELPRVERRILYLLGRAAEVAGEEALPWDRVIRAARWPSLARAEYERATPELRALYDALAAGLNHYLAHHPDPARRLDRYEPWHVVASERGFQVHFLMQAAAALNPGADFAPRPRDGSNAWAAGPSRCTGARALLLINPHIALEEVWEGHLRSAEGLELYGGSAYGYLLPLMGFNAHHGWTLTVNYPDVMDLYLETFDRPDDPLAYRTPTGYRQAIQWRETARVHTPEGLVDRELVLTRTEHGPLLGKLEGRPVAVRVARLDEGGMAAQHLAMMRADSLEAFRAALSARALIFHNVLYADRAGHIAYVYNGAVPRRDPALAWSRPVEGADPRARWQGYHDLSELPQVTDPASGYLQSCNSTPHTATTELDLGEFPPYLVGPEPDTLRAINSRRLLGRPEPFDFAAWCRAARDPYVPARLPWVPFLRAAWSQVRGERDPTIAAALRLLEAWDGYSRTDSPAATLFFLWFERVNSRIHAGTLDARAALEALAAVLGELGAAYGRWRVPWGELNRLQRAAPGPRPYSDERPSLPLAGGHGATGIQLDAIARSVGTRRRYAYHGDSFVCAVAFGPDGPRARSIVPFGVSRDPDSPHHTDQSAVYAEGRLKKVPFTPAQVAAAARRSYRPGEEE